MSPRSADNSRLLSSRKRTIARCLLYPLNPRRFAAWFWHVTNETSLCGNRDTWEVGNLLYRPIARLMNFNHPSQSRLK